MPFMDQLDAAMNGEPEATSEVVTAPPAPVEEFSNPESITGNGSSSSSHPTPTQVRFSFAHSLLAVAFRLVCGKLLLSMSYTYLFSMIGFIWFSSFTSCRLSLH